MPASVVNTPREEHLWEKARGIAEESGHKDDWAYVMGIFKKMNPDRFKEGMASRVATSYLFAYDEKGRDPDDGWAHGTVEPFQKTPGVGSQTPPAHDNQGAPLPPLEFPRMDIPGFKWHDRSKKFRRIAGRLLSPSSDPNTPPLTQREEMGAWDAGYEAASSLRARLPHMDDEAVWIRLQHDPRVPSRLTEDDIQYWEWRFAFIAGVQAFRKEQDFRVAEEHDRTKNFHQAAEILAAQRIDLDDMMRDLKTDVEGVIADRGGAIEIVVMSALENAGFRPQDIRVVNSGRGWLNVVGTIVDLHEPRWSQGKMNDFFEETFAAHCQISGGPERWQFRLGTWPSY